ncbi:MAG: MMPL family transporter [Planctomycetia bacterium]|nr:MMPL family transporter [Planctomycetia bacterium]
MAAAVLAGLYTFDHLRFKNRRLDLINPQSEWNQYWLDYIDKFGATDDMIVAVDGDSQEEILASVEAVAEKIQQRSDLYYSLFYRVDDRTLVSKGLHYASLDELQGLQMFLHNHEGVFRGDWTTLSIDRLLTQSTQPLLAPPNSFPKIVTQQCEQSIERMITSLEGVFGSSYHYVSPFPEVDIASRRKMESTDPQGFRVGDSSQTSSLFPGMGVPQLGTPRRAKTPSPSVIPAIPFPSENSDRLLAENRPEKPTITPPKRRDSVFSEMLPVGSYMAHYPPMESSEVPMFASSPYLAMAETSATETTSSTLPPTVENGGFSQITPDATGKDSGSLHYFWAVPNQTAILMVKMKEEKGEEFARGTKGIDTLRSILADVQAEHPHTQIQLTGLPVMENDEMRSSQDAMSIATWLSILGVTLLYMVFFRGLRHPVMAVFALFVGIGWTLAYITFFVGHLNILSISFTVILVGLGIDFGIHYTSRYLQCRREGDDTREALIHSAREVGPGILTGAMTTAAAFFMAGFTEFTGVAELGLIAGGGILFCCTAAFTVLPIFIYMSDCQRPVEKLPVPKNPNDGLAVFQLHPRYTLPIGLCVIVLLGMGIQNLRYDYNLLNLQPEGLESVALEMRLMEESKQSVWFALSMSQDRDLLLKRMEKFNQLESVERVEQILTLLPDENPQKEGLIVDIHETLAQTPQKAGMAPILSLREMENCFTKIVQYLKMKSEYDHYRQRIENLRKNFHALTPHDYFQRMQEYQKCLGEDLLAKFQTIQEISSPQPPQLSDLPQPLVDRFLSADGTYLLKVYGKGDLWDMENMEQFVREVRSVDPHVTGNPLQTYECSLQMKACYEEAAWLALGIVMILLYLDMQSIRHTLFALMPVFLGMLVTFGVMGYWEIPLNAANMIVLPLILGIGIDDGVHIVHDFRHQHGKNLYRVSPSISMSVILTSLTTILGFGTLMIAEHRGLQSLGIVLSLGVTSCWLTSLLILPALLSVFCRYAEDGREKQEVSEEKKNVPPQKPRNFTAPLIPEEPETEPPVRVTRYTTSPTGEVIPTPGRAA